MLVKPHDTRKHVARSQVTKMIEVVLVNHILSANSGIHGFSFLENAITVVGQENGSENRSNFVPGKTLL